MTGAPPTAIVNDARGCSALAILALIRGLILRRALNSRTRAATCAGPNIEAAAIAAVGAAPIAANRRGKLVAMPMVTIPEAVNMKAQIHNVPTQSLRTAGRLPPTA